MEVKTNHKNNIMTVTKKVIADLVESDYKIIVDHLRTAYPDKTFSKPQIIDFAVRETAARLERVTMDSKKSTK